MDKFSQKTLKEETEKIMSNAHLGELNGANVSVQIQVKRDNKVKLPQNIMVFQAFAYLAATTLKPATNKVLMLFFAHSPFENFIGIDVKTISEELKLTERSIISSLKELEENNIIIKIPHPSDKRRNDYFINPLAAWKGNSYTRKKMIEVAQINQHQLSIFDNKINNDKDLDYYNTNKSKEHSLLKMSEKT